MKLLSVCDGRVNYYVVNLARFRYTASVGRSSRIVATATVIRVRFHIIRNARIENVGKSQSCMVSKLRIIWKQTVVALV